MTVLKYNPKLKARAKELRKNSTLSEVLLWERIKNRQIKGYGFARQRPIDNYIVDFFCKELLFVIEIDGGSHYENKEYDDKRDNVLRELGIFVLRIGDSRIKKNIEGVIYEIEEVIKNLPLKGVPYHRA